MEQDCSNCWWILRIAVTGLVGGIVFMFFRYRAAKNAHIRDLRRGMGITEEEDDG